MAEGNIKAAKVRVPICPLAARFRPAAAHPPARAQAVSDIVRTTLGPRSMLKMLLDPMGGIVITNDGNAILREVDVSHPGAKSMIELSRAQDEEVGDGTTSVIILGARARGPARVRGPALTRPQPARCSSSPSRCCSDRCTPRRSWAGTTRCGWARGGVCVCGCVGTGRCVCGWARGGVCVRV